MAQPAFPVCLTVSGSDSGGGAGLQGDLKVFSALGVFGTTAVTALTAQNTTGVKGVLAIDPAFVRLQIETVCTDFPVAAAKTGMLGDIGTIRTVAEFFQAHPHCPLVVDPVAISRNGDPLIDPQAVGTLRDRLLPLATVVTPNRHEVALLSGTGPVTDAASLREAARILFERCGRPILAKGGSVLPGALDILIDADGEHPLTLAEDPIPSRSTHGTGCALSAAITAFLARGQNLRDAVAEAKQYVAGAIRHAPGLGAGHGPIQHGWMARAPGVHSEGL